MISNKLKQLNGNFIDEDRCSAVDNPAGDGRRLLSDQNGLLNLFFLYAHFVQLLVRVHNPYRLTCNTLISTETVHNDTPPCDLPSVTASPKCLSSFSPTPYFNGSSLRFLPAPRELQARATCIASISAMKPAKTQLCIYKVDR